MRGKRSGASVALLDEILADAFDDAGELEALRRALADNVKLPCDGEVAGGPVTVTKFGFDGNARRGLTATVRGPEGRVHEVGAADVVLAKAADQRYIDVYRLWMGVDSAVKPRRAKKAKTLAPPLAEGNTDVAILSISGGTARCRELQSGESLVLRARWLWAVVPGEIATIKPARRWVYGGTSYLSGRIEATRLDAKALGLTPLGLKAYGKWDPAEEYWGEPGEPIPAWAHDIVRRGPRPQFEMEQVIPGEDPDDPWNDPIIESNDRKDAGDFSGAYDILMGLCRADLRCLDAHAHLGNLLFDTRTGDALRHYEAGVRIGELSLGADFDGVLPWGMIDNRPFLRCLHGYGLCLWRLKRFPESAAVFERMLWLNPSDNQGVRCTIEEARAGRAWEPDR